MKRLILAVMVAGVGLVPLLAPAAVGLPIDIYVVHRGEKHKLRDIDADSMSICSLKQRLAKRFGLEMRNFDLMNYAGPLDDTRTVAGAYIMGESVLQINDGVYSSQCTR